MDFDKNFVTAGTINSLYNVDRDDNVFVSIIDRAIVHPRYDADNETGGNDIGLIFLKQSINFNKYIQPIALPNSKADLFVGRNAIVSGWGRTDKGTIPQLNLSNLF